MELKDFSNLRRRGEETPSHILVDYQSQGGNGYRIPKK
jgi:hypothetical protein